MLAGHRNTHYGFLKAIQQGEIIHLQTVAGNTLQYEVIETKIVHEREIEYLGSSQEDKLTLITCYPFDAIRPGGPLRYLVIAKQHKPDIST